MIDTPADEEARAQLWRDQVRRRVAYQNSLWYALAGDPAVNAALRAAWQPVVDWIAEAESPQDDPNLDPGQPDPILANQVNV